MIGLVKAPNKGEGKLNSNQLYSTLERNFVSHLVRVGGVALNVGSRMNDGRTCLLSQQFSTLIFLADPLSSELQMFFKKVELYEYSNDDVWIAVKPKRTLQKSFKGVIY